MNKGKLIAIKEDTKIELDRLKLCRDESYNSLLSRIIRNKLEEKENATAN